MRKLFYILAMFSLISCGSGGESDKESKAKKATRPENPKIDLYQIDGFGLLELDFSVNEFKAYEEVGFDKQVAANLVMNDTGKVITDSIQYYPLPLFQNGPKVYFQALAKSDGFVQVILDELYGKSIWVAPGPGQRIIGWPAFMLEAKTVTPLGELSFVKDLDVNSDPIYDVPENCYRAVQSSAEWLHLMKKEDCDQKELPKMIYLKWREGDRRVADFEFSK
jgi:hypothetical protein